MRWDWIAANLPRLGELVLVHVALAIPPILVALLCSVPIGWVAHRCRWFREIIVTLTGALYVIPSLALFIVMPLLLGTSILSPLNVVVAMTIFGIALQVRATADAFDTVPNAIKSAATAVGYSNVQRALMVELPLAGPGILAGVRVVSASTISLISVGALIGVQSLGTLFTEGFQRSFPTQIIAGVLGTILVALVFDVVLVFVGRVLMPWSRRRR